MQKLAATPTQNDTPHLVARISVQKSANEAGDDRVEVLDFCVFSNDCDSIGRQQVEKSLRCTKLPQ